MYASQFEIFRFIALIVLEYFMTHWHNQPEQLFTYKLGGRKPTHSGKSPIHSRHFAMS